MRLIIFCVTETFKRNPPQSPIKALCKLKPNHPVVLTFTKSEDCDETIAKLTCDNQTFEGRGSNKAQAKGKAYRKAVQFFDTKKEIVFF